MTNHVDSAMAQEMLRLRELRPGMMDEPMTTPAERFRDAIEHGDPRFVAPAMNLLEAAVERAKAAQEKADKIARNGREFREAQDAGTEH